MASQADAIRAFLGRLASLRTDLEGHGGACNAMLRREGSSPDLLALRRETEALNRQAAKLAERGQGRLALIEEAEERVKEFYTRLTELHGLLNRAEEGLSAQGVVGTEVDIIKQQLQEFKVGFLTGFVLAIMDTVACRDMGWRQLFKTCCKTPFFVFVFLLL